MKEIIFQSIEESIRAKKSILDNDEFILNIISASEQMVRAFKNGNKVMICGNGGSAADALHIAGEMVCKFKMDRQPLPVIALAANSSVMTAIGNDYDYSRVFDRQLEAFGKTGDVLIGISTSGNSGNIINAFQKAKGLGVYTVGLLGKDGGRLKNLSDVSLVVPADDTPRIQESHIMIGHIICEIVEKELFGSK